MSVPFEAHYCGGVPALLGAVPGSVLPAQPTVDAKEEIEEINEDGETLIKGILWLSDWSRLEE